ncbi:MAG: hypothetical protein ABIW82_18440 [Dokdonella sp.]
MVEAQDSRTVDEESDFERRRAASKAIQDEIRARFAKPGTLDAAIAGGWAKRKLAIEMLGFLGRDDDARALALREPDTPAVVDHALKLLPAPVALVVHRLTMKRAQPAMAMQFVIARGHYLHAEREIMSIVAKAPRRLVAGTLAAFGRAGFMSAVPILHTHARIDEVRTYADAIAAGRKQDKPELPVSSPDRVWDGPTERAFAAVGALRQLDAMIDIGAVETWRDAVRAKMGSTPSFKPSSSHARLTWVLFDAGADQCFDEWLGHDGRYGSLADMATTLLKRGDTTRLERLVPMFDALGAADVSVDFCHWPLADWCDARGLVRWPSRKFTETYCLSRDAGMAPPPWWSWTSEWTAGFYSARLRGTL